MLGIITGVLDLAVRSTDYVLEDVSPSAIILSTAALMMIGQVYHSASQAWRARHNTSLKQRTLDVAYQLTKNISLVQKRVGIELDKNLASTREKLAEQRKSMNLRSHMPEQGLSATEILREFDIDPAFCAFDFTSPEVSALQFKIQAGDGKDSGALYAVHTQEFTELLKEAYAKTELSNPMHDKWPRINAMQAEVISWCQNLFHGSQDGYGVLTHGGTTSIIEAMAAYVTHARSRGITQPEIVVPETAHAAFKKAAELTGATLITVPVDPKTGAVSAEEMSCYLSSNTAVMVGSAPSFMNGINDPISKLGELAKKKKVPFHVDACLGGFLTAFTDTSAEPLDFQVAGVTSISADFHKYGCSPKGSSVCLFSKDCPALPVYAALNWAGGLYATPGILDGSTSGARVAEAYATLAYYGKEQYSKIAQDIIALRGRLQEQVRTLTSQNQGITAQEISVFGDPKASVIGFRSTTLDPHWIADALDQKGWKLNLLQNPKGFHLCLTHVHTLIPQFEQKFAEDLRDAIETVMAYPADKKPSGNVKVYGAVGMLPTDLQREICVQYQRARLAFFGAAEQGTEERAVATCSHSL